MNNKPLQGIRILDFGWILSIPHCTAWLGTLGAEVIRVESLARIDPVRAALGGGADGIHGVNRASPFNGLNFGKQSITLNMATSDGQGLAKELVKTCDVVCENYATGVMERLGLGYEALRAVKPDIILMSGSTLGTTGPERDSTGWGPNVSAYAGLPFISGYVDGPPADLGGTWPDYGIGVMMVFALLSAVHHQRRTGQGQHVEIAMGEAVTAMIPEAVLEYTLNGRETPRQGNRDPRAAPHDVYPCAGEDRWVAIAVTDDAEWRALCRAIGRPELAHDSRFAGTAARLCHRDELDDLVGAWTRWHTPHAVMETLQAAGVAAGPVMNILDLMDDPHLQERGFVVAMEHPEVGRRTVAGLPAHFGAMAELTYTAAPCLGAHNDDVFGGLLDLDGATIQRLHDTQVIY